MKSPFKFLAYLVAATLGLGVLLLGWQEYEDRRWLQMADSEAEETLRQMDEEYARTEFEACGRRES